MATIAQQVKHLPDQPGVYTFRNVQSEVIYVGRATSLRTRVKSYFAKKFSVTDREARPIERMIDEVVQITHEVTPTVIESVILEANTIKQLRPKYNVMLRDNRSFAYLGLTKDEYPRFTIVRGHELGVDWFVGKQEVPKQFQVLFGPFKSAHVINTTLKILRKIFPYATCKPGRSRACLYYQIGLCPGVCISAVSSTEYRKRIRPIILFFQGKKRYIVRDLNAQMKTLAQQNKFERAGEIRDQLFAIEHIQDIALIQKEYEIDHKGNPILGRIEAYDISNISGTSATGSMVVFEAGEANKSQYRKFRIKTVSKSNDVAMMREVIGRRLAHPEWPLPDVFVIDGGKPQVNCVHHELESAGITIPILGIAKGPTRKNARIVQIGGGAKLARLARTYLSVLLAARDEAHRFAVQYHRKRRERLIRN